MTHGLLYLYLLSCCKRRSSLDTWTFIKVSLQVDQLTSLLYLLQFPPFESSTSTQILVNYGTMGRRKLFLHPTHSRTWILPATVGAKQRWSITSAEVVEQRHGDVASAVPMNCKLKGVVSGSTRTCSLCSLVWASCYICDASLLARSGMTVQFGHILHCKKSGGSIWCDVRRNRHQAQSWNLLSKKSVFCDAVYGMFSLELTFVMNPLLILNGRCKRNHARWTYVNLSSFVILECLNIWKTLPFRLSCWKTWPRAVPVFFFHFFFSEEWWKLEPQKAGSMIFISPSPFSPGWSRRCHRGCGRRNDRGGKCEVVKLEVSFCQKIQDAFLLASLIIAVFHGQFWAAFVWIMFHSRGMLKRIPR